MFYNKFYILVQLVKYNIKTVIYTFVVFEMCILRPIISIIIVISMECIFNISFFNKTK